MYENRTVAALMGETYARLGISPPPQEGTLEDVAVRAACYIGETLFGNLDRLLAIAFPTRDSGAAIAWRAADFDITPKPGTRAVLMLRLTGTPGAVIPVQTAVLTADSLEFDTLEAVTLLADGTAETSAQATNVGAGYNVPPGAIVRLMTNVPGLSGAANPEAAAGGTDPESDEALFDRLDAYRKRPATSGNLAQYEQWAREVSGVGDARAIDCWAGAGTVKLVLVDMAMQPVSEAVRQAVSAHIAQARPAGGVAVTVESAARVEIKVAVRVTLDTSATLQSVTAALREALEAYLLTLTFRASSVVYNRIVYILMGLAGVTDFAALTVNGGAANVPLTDTQVPVLGLLEVTTDAVL